MREEKLVPKRRFKEFENDGAWEQRKLGELGSVVMNKRIFKDQTSETGDIPFYKIGTFGGKPDAYISRGLFEEYKARYPYPEIGDILISASGSIGRTVEYTGKDEYFQDSNIVWLKHDNRLNNLFLKQFYKIVEWEGLEGSTIKRLYNKNILETRIFVTSLAEQQRIGTFFTNLDKLIILHQRKLKKLKETKSAYLSEMFPKEGERYPKRRFAGFTDPWEQRKLGEVANYRNGKAHENDISDNGKYIVVNSKFVSTDGEVRKYSEQQIEPLYKDEITFVLSDVPNGRAIARTFLIDGDNKYTLNQRIAGITPHEDVTPYFLYILMNRNKYFLEFDDGVKQTNLSVNDVMDFEEAYPCFEEQQKVGNFFKNLDNLITLHQRKLEKLENLKKAYLNEMFV